MLGQSTVVRLRLSRFKRQGIGPRGHANQCLRKEPILVVVLEIIRGFQQRKRSLRQAELLLFQSLLQQRERVVDVREGFRENAQVN
jgi:hypothetical protein